MLFFAFFKLCFVCLFGLYNAPSQANGALSPIYCIDEDENAVNYFIGYKVPELEQFVSSEREDLQSMSSGYALLRVTERELKSDTKDIRWFLSEQLITSDESIVGKTLNQLYNDAGKHKELSVIMYSDQTPPDGKGGYVWLLLNDGESDLLINFHLCI